MKSVLSLPMWIRFTSVCLAVVFLSAAPTYAASGAAVAADVNACSGCTAHVNLPNLQCGVYVQYAVAACCGMGNGSASCTGENFNVTCQGGRTCTCNDTGGECSGSEMY